MTPERLEKFKRVIKQRQPNLTVVLENVHDPHNIGAVLRTCDAVGIFEVYIIYTEDKLSEERLVLGKRTAAGARKWINAHVYRDVDLCFKHLRTKYDKI